MSNKDLIAKYRGFVAHGEEMLPYARPDALATKRDLEIIAEWKQIIVALEAADNQGEPVGIVQALSIAGFPMQDSTGVEWLKQVPAGARLYARSQPLDRKAIEESVRLVIEDEGIEFCALAEAVTDEVIKALKGCTI